MHSKQGAVLLLVCLGVLVVHNTHAAPQDWSAHSYQGRVYFYNSATDESTWDRPAGCTAQPDDDSAPSKSLKVSSSTNSNELLSVTSYSVNIMAHRATEPIFQEDVTLVLQGDLARIESGALARIAGNWKGPISAAVLVTPDAQPRLLSYIETETTDEVKRWADVHVIMASNKWKHYPINKMRNYALSAARTDYVLLMDIDEDLPFTMFEVRDELNQAKTSTASASHTVFALTAWQWATENPPSGAPRSLGELKQRFSQGQVAVKHPHFPAAYSVPGFDFWAWQSLTQAQRVSYADSFEPYFIAKKSALPSFDERFVGFGGNKAIHTLKMALEGFEFVLLPKVFVWENNTPSASAKSRAPAKPQLMKDAWWELGMEHGCERCTPRSCVSVCSKQFNKFKKAQHALQPDVPKIKEVQPPQQPVEVIPMPDPSVFQKAM